VLVLGPPAGASSKGSVPANPLRADALEALRALVEAGARPRPAAKVVSKLTGVAANELYRQLTNDQPTD
jgi:hypothetical protein